MNEQKDKKGMSTVVKVLLGCGGCFGILVIGGIILSAMGIWGIGKVANEIDESIQEQEQENEAKKENPYAMNEEVTVENVIWKVLSADDKGSTIASTSSYGEDCVSSSGKYVQVKVTVTNNSDDLQSLGGLNLYDSEEREYTSASDLFGCVDDEFLLIENINPGITLDFVQTYEVPTDASGFMLKVTDLNFLSDKHEYVSLGF